MKTIAGILLLVVTALASAQSPQTNRYHLSPIFPKYVSAHMEFRDPSGVRWPTFLYGKPLTNGFLTLDPPAATFALLLNYRVQKNGDQSRRVLASLPTNTTAVVRVSSLSKTISGSLEINQRSVPFNAPVTFKHNSAGRSDEKNEALLASFTFDTTATALGLPENGPVRVRLAFTAYAQPK